MDVIQFETSGKKIEKDGKWIEEKSAIPKKILPSNDLQDDRLKLKYEESLKRLCEMNDINFENIPKIVQESFVISHFSLNDDDNSSFEKPDWLDMEKFKKGQAFARENFAGIFMAQLYGLLCLLCHEDGVKTLTLTKKSHTPYSALKRYVSTGERVRNWMTEDPWTEGTKANKDMQTVRRMHRAVRKKILELDYDEIDALSAIRDPYCPALPIIQKDFSNLMCPASMDYRLYRCSFSYPDRPKSINQLDMSLTAFGFMGFIILYPHEFGICSKSDEDLENFCHLWRSISYLLGVNDEANFCRGSLDDVKQRGRQYIQYYVKPSFVNIHHQWEHMLRCIFQGFSYVFVLPTFEIALLRVADIINIEMPNLYASLSYIDWIRYLFEKYIMPYVLRFAILRNMVNKYANKMLDKVINLDEAKLAKIEEKSMKTMLHASVGT